VSKLPSAEGLYAFLTFIFRSPSGFPHMLQTYLN